MRHFMTVICSSPTLLNTSSFFLLLDAGTGAKVFPEERRKRKCPLKMPGGRLVAKGRDMEQAVQPIDRSREASVPFASIRPYIPDSERSLPVDPPTLHRSPSGLLWTIPE